MKISCIRRSRRLQYYQCHRYDVYTRKSSLSVCLFYFSVHFIFLSAVFLTDFLPSLFLVEICTMLSSSYNYYNIFVFPLLLLLSFTLYFAITTTNTIPPSQQQQQHNNPRGGLFPLHLHNNYVSWQRSLLQIRKE